MKRLLIAGLILLNTLSVFAQSSYDFTRSDTVSLNAVSKWKNIGGMDVAGSSFGVSSNQGYPYHPSGSANYGGVYWDSTVSAPYQVRIVLKQLSGTDNAKNFYLVVSDTNTFNSYGAYTITLQQMASAVDYMYLRRTTNLNNSIENGGVGFYTSDISAPVQNSNHAANDTFYINVYADGRKTAVRKRGATVDSLSTTDVATNVTTGAWVWLYGRVAPTAFLIDDFSISAISGGEVATVDTVPPSITSFSASNSTPSTAQSFSLSGAATDNYGINYVIVDSSQNGSTWAKWDSVKVNIGTPVTSYSYTSPLFTRASADTVYFRMRAVEDSTHVGYLHADTSSTVEVRISEPGDDQYSKKVFAWLTFDDTRWAGTTSGSVPVDSIPWDVITHASLFAANGQNPPQDYYITQYPYLAARAHQSGVDAGICVGGYGDAAVVTMIADSTQWTPWINTYVGYLDASRLDFIDFDLEGSYSVANVRQFFKRLYDTLNVSTRYSGNNTSRKPYIVLTINVLKGISYGADTALMNRVEFVNLMTYDYNNNAWGRTTFDNSPKSYTNFDGTGPATDSIGTGVNAVAPSMQRMAMRVAAAGWPKNKITVGMDFNGGYWTGTTYIRQVPPGSSGGSNATFAGNWTSGDNFNAIPSDSIFFDQIAQAYWARWNNKLWTWLALPGRDSGVIATRKIVDSMGLGGVCIWNFGEEVWYQGATIPTGGRGWHMSQIRTHFTGIVDTNVRVINPPVSFTPANGATNVLASVTLNWEDITGASKYHVEFGPVGGALSVDDTTIAVSQKAVSSLVVSTQYSYRVRVKNAANVWGPWSNDITFTTVPAVPGAPTLTVPADAATGQAQTITMFWAAPGTGGTPTNYGFELDTDAGFTPAILVDSSLTGLSRQVAGLANNTTYHWRVRAKSYSGGWGAYATTRTFTTSAAVPNTPTLLSPINGAANQSTTPVLTWTRPAGADSFRVQIDSTTDFTTPRKDTTTASSSYTASLTSGLTFYWRVLSKGTAGSSPYSSPFQITIGTDIQPPAPGSPYRSTLTYDPTSGKYSTSPQPGVEMLNVPLSSLPLPYDTNTVMWGVRGYKEFDGDTVSYSGSGAGLTWSQILDSIRATTFDTLKLRSPLIKQDLRFQTGITGEDSSSRLTIVPEQASQNATVTLPVKTGKTAVSDAGERVDFQSISLGEKLALSDGGTASDLSNSGGTSQVLMKEGAGDTVTVRQLTTADISGYVAGGSTDTTSLSNRINAKADSSTVLYWADTTLANGPVTNYDISLKATTTAVLKNADSTTIRNYSNSLYATPAQVGARADSATALYWADTTLANGVATNYDLSLKLNSAALDTSTVLFWADTTSTIATAYDLTQVTASLPTPSQSYELMEDFLSATGAGNHGLTMTSSGTGSSVSVIATADTNRWGIKQFITGTTASGYAGVNTGTTSGNEHLFLNGGVTIFETAIQIPTLFDGTAQEGQVQAGFMDLYAVPEPTDGAYFYYHPDTNSGKWKIVARSNTTNQTRTATDSTVTAGRWYKLRIESNADASSITYYINGASVGTINTLASIPRGTGRTVGVGVKIGKLMGTTARSMQIDYLYVKKTFNPGR